MRNWRRCMMMVYGQSIHQKRTVRNGTKNVTVQELWLQARMKPTLRLYSLYRFHRAKYSSSGSSATSGNNRHFVQTKPVHLCLCEHLRACEQCIYFFEHKQRFNLSCEERALQITEHFVNFALGVISFILKKENVFRKVTWSGNMAGTVQPIPAGYS